MKVSLFTALLLLTTFFTGFSQSKLEGLWLGVITTGGLDTKVGYKFELVLEVEGKTLKGKSYVHIGQDEIIEMDVEGYLYDDRSIYLSEIRFISTAGKETRPPFNRKYELLYKRSIWDSSLEGYWQEIKHETFDPRRERGRIFLKKMEGDRA